SVVFTTYDDYPDAGGAVKQLWIYDPSATPGTGAGKLSVETWNSVTGTHVSSIPLNTEPSSTSEISIFETPKNIGDNYGSRVRGYVIPPTTGNYTFWIASDDRSELWLSTDDTPANKRRIAYVAGWTTSRQWDKYAPQQSAPVSLVAGRKYYVEALLKEGTGGDHLAVGWQLPNGTLERPIPGERLMSFSGSIDTSPRVAISAPDDEQAFTAPADVLIRANAYDVDGSIVKVEFYNGTTKLGEDATNPYSFTWNDVTVGEYTIVAKAIDNDGDTDTHSILIYVRDPAACANTGMIRQEFWTNVTGTRVSDIPTDTPPDFTQDLTLFEGPGSPVGDNYGSRIRGYICPKTAGEYTFWISGDDQVELWLSTDDNPANKRRIAYHNGWTQKREWDRYATQQSAPITLEPGQRYYIEALMKEGSGADHVSVGWQFPGGFVQRPIIGDYLIPFEASEAPPTACEGTGTISVETWTGIDGTRVSSIPVNTAPNLTGERNIFEAPTNVGSNFGSRFRGYVCVPTTGNYTFWIASDDHSELWLSTDNDPANKRLIANVAGWTTPRQWDKYTTQQSAPIPLVAGQQYYIEALYKEDEGGDNMAVGWQLPDGTMERPIPGNRLSPFEDATSTMAARTSAEQELYQQINVYPNPIRSGDAQLTISGYEGIDKIIETDVEIMNMTGEVVFSEKVLCGGNCGSYLMKLNEQLVPGVYVVNMQTNGVRTAKRLLVK
ncbi:MAG TPA: PA14 domain-containing protein, partial [Chryseosolibacter sp.]|nr:PA14 domain-containing protein [Chryseosolibacter sp.]